MTRPAWHRTAAAAAVLVLGTMTACSAPQPELADAAAANLQSRAAAIRTAAADGNYQTALRALDGLTDDLTRAAGQGEVSFPRYQSIDAALGRLRSDLNAALKAAAPSPSPAAPSARPVPSAATAPVNQSPPSSAAPVQPAVPAPAKPAKPKSQKKAGKASSIGKAGQGKPADPGNGKGNGKGHSKAKNK
jgi:hypothetical protein